LAKLFLYDVRSRADIEKLIAIGAKIEQLRKESKISRVQMAFELETNEKQLRLIEKGEINTGVLSLYKIAEILNVETKELLP
tara:strand:+ start:67 stop:312 length:246 start_codon:yes stop_codon:yes gene_type:complete